MLALRNSSLLCRAWLVTLAFGFAAVPLAHAVDTPVSGEALVILAKEEPGDFDPKLKQYPALQKGSFRLYKSMKVLSTTSFAITEGKDAAVDLPTGGKAQLKLVQRMPDGRLKVEMSIARPGKPDAVLTVVASSEPFFVAGQAYEGGVLVIGVRVSNAVKK